ncbi:MAG: hypothetical protein OET81_09085 [Desulfobacteraceae bacterium]|nr:hypothetical protein [Desulfobacteraceae bacterium]MDH3572165.1 hypothetical protein [Desulfobacteraceae bacterium]MDH3722293.1 hypothetical protein [Desulfobacteraceae bacterium]MDH3835962.1 hypothetical protein [Desulfobacteraceae bacterium]MDH3880383.1 hypothetical protein [Desulfobacteraceae bacterium]
MKPLYFPFTYIPKSAGKTLSACFRQTAVYQISGTKIPKDMQELSRNGILDIRIPVEANGKFLDNVLKDYRAWVNIHQGTETAFLAAMANKIPFFDENASSQIRADLKKIGKQIPAEEKPDPLFNAKLFLHMAQELDLQNAGLDQDLMDIDAMEDDFMKNLKWEDDDDHARAVVRRQWDKNDPGHFMTTERINAWVSLMLQDPQASGLFITTSRAVLEHLIEIVSEMEQVIGLDAIPMGVDEDEALSNWQDDLMKTLEMLATENWPVSMDNMANPPEIPGSEKSVSLTLYIVPNKTPYECFSDCVGTDVFQGESAKTDTRFKNTIIGLVEKSG